MGIPSDHQNPLPPFRRPSRRTLLGTAAGAALAGAFPPPVPALAAAAPDAALPPDREAADEVHGEFLHAWRGYTSSAWGYDEVRPVSGTHHDFFAPGATFGLSIVEALDTLFLMGEDEELASGCDWIEAHFDPVQDVSIDVFESVIRLVGGLLAGYLATGRHTLLDRCREFADRLLPAFTASPTGIPYTHVNLRTGEVTGRSVALAEAGTNVVEFGLLSRLTGDPRYYQASMRAYQAVISRRSAAGLLGTSVDAETGRWTDTADVAPNPPVDSFYEYLWTGSALLGDARLRSWYRSLTGAVLARLADTGTGRLWFRQADMATGAHLGTSQSELGSFYAGLLGKGGDLARGGAYYRSWTEVLDRYPVLPEGIDYTTLDATDKGNQLRPEYANSAFDLWRLTQDPYYKLTAYRYFSGLGANLRVDGGYTVADDVTARPMALGDLTPAYVFAENFKYLYLMFADTPRFDYRTGLLSTEGKVVRGLRRTG